MGRIEPRPKDVNDKILAREFVLEKTLDGKESLKITIKSSKTRWGGGKKVPHQTRVGLRPRYDRSNRSLQPVRSVQLRVHPKISSPSARKLDTSKKNEQKVQGRVANKKPTVGQLLNKCTKAIHKVQPLKKRSRSPPR